MTEKCYQCGGELEVELVCDFKDWVCQQCGITVDSKEVIEEQEEYIPDDIEVME